MIAIDLFAGAGGFTEGATAAGLTVAWAANHWRAAVDVHARNHPGTAHACQDLHQADWSTVPRHVVLLASPACQGHSRARGKDRPHHDAARSTAWAVVACAEAHRPALVVVENVPEFGAWELFPAWSLAMRTLGYALSPVVVDAADRGVPQHRRRLFVVGTRSKAPLRLELPRRDHVPALAAVDFKAGAWSPIDRPGRAAATLRRIAEGRRLHGDRFAVSYYGSTRGGRSLSLPIGTITTRDRWALIDGDRMRMLTIDEARRIMGFREGYQLPPSHKEAMHMLGNAVCPPVASDVIAAAVARI